MHVSQWSCYKHPPSSHHSGSFRRRLFWAATNQRGSPSLSHLRSIAATNGPIVAPKQHALFKASIQDKIDNGQLCGIKTHGFRIHACYDQPHDTWSTYTDEQVHQSKEFGSSKDVEVHLYTVAAIQEELVQTVTTITFLSCGGIAQSGNVNWYVKLLY